MRLISIYRRKPNLVDILIPRQANADRYRLKWANNFDVSPFATFITSEKTGFRDVNVDDATVVTVHGDYVRIVFNPATYSIPDDQVFWIKFFPVDFSGVEGSGTPPLMVLTPDPGGSYFPQYVITGNAPNVGTLATALEIHFPRQMRDLRLQNTASMYMAFDPNGPEVLFPGDPLPKDISAWATQSLILVRGQGASVPFSLLFTLAYTQ